MSTSAAGTVQLRNGGPRALPSLGSIVGAGNKTARPAALSSAGSRTPPRWKGELAGGLMPSPVRAFSFLLPIQTIGTRPIILARQKTQPVTACRSRCACPFLPRGPASRSHIYFRPRRVSRKNTSLTHFSPLRVPGLFSGPTFFFKRPKLLRPASGSPATRCCWWGLPLPPGHPLLLLCFRAFLKVQGL